MFWIVLAVLIVGGLLWQNGKLQSEIARMRASEQRSLVCQRCGEKGTVQPRSALQAVGPNASPPQLCAICFNAVDEWGRHRYMLETERRMKFGRYPTIVEAERELGDEGVPVMALFLVAKHSMDMARRACTSDAAFARYRPAIEKWLADESRSANISKRSSNDR